jgi:hypothetical protein
MTDEELERRLRAWYRSEIPDDETAPVGLRLALAQIPSTVPSPLHGSSTRRRMGMLAVAAVLTTLVGGALVGSGTFRTSPDVRPSNPAVVILPDPTATVPLPTLLERVPVATAPATPSSSPGPCMTDGVKVVTGDALPTLDGDRLEGLVQGRGVYLAGRSPTLWAVGPGNGKATLIASVSPRPNILDVLDMSLDGANALIRAGNISPAGGSPECADLYIVRTDGSGATRLTTFGAGRFVTGAAFSPDDRRVAYHSWDPGMITVLDLGSRVTVDQACNITYGSFPTQIEWSPTGDKMAVVCDGALTIFDAGGTSAPVENSRADETLDFHWTDDRTLLVAEEPTGPGLRGTHIDAIDVVSRTATVVGRLQAPSIEGMQGTFHVSPDGRWLMFQGAMLTAVPWDQLKFVGYLVPMTDGTPTQIMTEDEASSLIGWTADSQALVFIGLDETGVQTLTRLEVETLRRSTIGTLPNGYLQGIWRIP